MRLPYTLFQKLMIGISIMLVIGMIGYLIINYNSLPNKVPTHFGIDGNPDTWGNKISLWFLPILSCIMLLMLLTIIHYPNSWNISDKINDNKKDYYYLQIKNMLCVITFSIIFMCSYIQVGSIKAMSLNAFFLSTIIILAILGPIVWSRYIYSQSK
ncbi:putative membrane protein [Bacilli bacterium PM5-3]|nr:putative membrane protein [Bacilli bacterium PM5-3]MDH6603295.1 putative membrane protein [Bacilli bacterium PM5-9]